MNQIVNYLYNSFSFVKDFFSLSGSVVYNTFKGPFYYRLMIQNMYDFGYRSLFIVVFFAISVGFVCNSSHRLFFSKLWGKNLCFKNYDTFSFFRDWNGFNCIYISW